MESAVADVTLGLSAHPGTMSTQFCTDDPEPIFVVPLGHGRATALLDQLPGAYTAGVKLVGTCNWSAPNATPGQKVPATLHAVMSATK